MGVCVLAAVGAFFVLMLKSGVAEGAARAAAFIALIAANFSLIVVNRSYGASVTGALRQPNPAFSLMLPIIVALLAGALAAGPMRDLFHFEVPRLELIGIALAIGAAVLIALEATKTLLASTRSVYPRATRD